VNLFYFGDSNRELFGAYHAPAASARARGAALLCPPWGQEYLVSHRILRRLAKRLSEKGYHVLRFDYYGTGDSAGDRDEGDLASWYGDAEMALEELRDMSGVEQVATFGVRLGAIMAWRLAMKRPDVRTTVLWDPVINGAQYINELVSAQQEVDRWNLGRSLPKGGVGSWHLLGFPMTRAMRESVEAVQLSEFGLRCETRLHLYYSDSGRDHRVLQDALQRAGTPFHAETLEGQTPWLDEESTAVGTVAARVLQRMVEAIA
jgi:pimeloyl-ACP methyl ester carboxylesterase